MNKGLRVEFIGENCRVLNKNDLFVHAKLTDGLYKVLQTS